MRDDFMVASKELLAKRVNYLCSNPNCRRQTAGPHTDPAKSINVGVAAHLTAASPGGPRFDPSLSIEQRKSTENGIWLCQTCAKLVDNDPQRYTLKVLQGWKRTAEEIAMLELEGNSVQEVKPIGISTSNILIPKLYGLDYDEARSLLIEAGWQPLTNHWSYADNIEIRYGNGHIFWQKGYHEIQSSAGTGYAICSFKFVDVHGNCLIVITAGEEYPDKNIKSSVYRYYLGSSPKSATSSWPEDRGVYVTDSSQSIPTFPDALDGYQTENNKDFWGKPFSSKGTLRIFDSNGWTGIQDFPNTMNGCSAGVFMIRWRSACPKVLIASTLGYSPEVTYGEAKTGGFGYMYGTNCEQPLFRFAETHNNNETSLVDIYYELKFWHAAP